MLYNNSKDVLDAISKIVSEDRQKYTEEKNSLEGKLQLEAMSKMKMEYVVPEEIEKEGVAHFMGAAAAAHKAGKKQFAFGGKTYPVKIKSHIAKQVNEEQIDEVSKKTLGSYVKKASVDMANRSSDATAKRTMAGADYAYNISRGMAAKTADAHMKKDREAAQPDVKKAVQRFRGIEKAVGRLAKEEVEHVEEATITQGANKGKQWTPSTTGPTNKIKPSSNDLPSPMDGATAPPPKAVKGGMKKEGMFDTIASKVKSAFSGASPLNPSAGYGSTNYGGTKSGWSGDRTGSSQYSGPGVTSTSASSSMGPSMSDFLTGKVPLKTKTETTDPVKKIAGKIAGKVKQIVSPEVKPMKVKKESVEVEGQELAEAAQKDTPGQHVCAVHVKHQTFGEGKTLTTQHAEPAADGSIEWYDVMFEHGIEKQVPTADLEITLAETHAHCKDKK